MAGDTSRFLIVLSLPIVSFVFWFLKRKTLRSVVSKADQVDTLASERNFFEFDSMKIKTVENCEGSSNISKMQLKEDLVSPNSNTNKAAQTNGSSTPDDKKRKSKLREKARTCPVDYISNGSPQDNGAELAVALQNIDLNTNGSAVDELVSNTESTSSEMDNDECLSQSDANGGTGSVTEDASEYVECDDVNCPSDDKIDPTRTESHESLLPLDCVDAAGDPSSTAATYCDSVVSNDSGRGGSEIHYEPLLPGYSDNVVNYAFEIPQEYVGRLIGKNGSTVRYIKDQTNADIFVKRHPSSRDSKVALLTGTEEEINSALRVIRRKFPLEKYPTVTLSQICFLPFMPCPENLMLRLPESTFVPVYLASTVTAGHFFLHQPTHPTYPIINDLIVSMSYFYNNDVNAPALPHVEKGYICAVSCNNKWYRAEVDEVYSDRNECRVKFLDYGGYAEVSRSALRQMNYQFMNMPFLAIECYLAHVCPLEGETEISLEATNCFNQLCNNQILSSCIVAYAENGIPLVQIYNNTGGTMIDINKELINSGLVRSVEPQQPQLVS